jgi:hypothetical protein
VVEFGVVLDLWVHARTSLTSGWDLGLSFTGPLGSTSDRETNRDTVDFLKSYDLYLSFICINPNKSEGKFKSKFEMGRFML